MDANIILISTCVGFSIATFFITLWAILKMDVDDKNDLDKT